MIASIADLQKIKQEYLAKLGAYEHLALICYGTGCVSANCQAVRDALVDELAQRGLTDKISVIERGCMGTCAVGPVVYILPDETYYTEMDPEKMRDVVEKHFVCGQPVEAYTFYDYVQRKRISDIHEVSFFKDQVRIALRNCGLIDVNTIASYIANDGYLALAQTLVKNDRKAVIETLKASGLRGRGGGGFPTGVKWEAGYNAPEGQKYIICNADEGDPGAFMDRSVFEGDPHSVIEGMLLGGFAIGADKGVVYIRAEYPIAIRRLEAAMAQAREEGLLGKNIFGSGFDFEMEIRIGAGAFVCGEETALMASVEGQRGEPRQKPPFPFQKGLFGKPSIINNVETFANVPPIILNGADWFRQYGTAESPGTKVFALTGDINNSGLVEIPMGMPLGDIIFDIGGGIPDGKKYKSAQTGGPSGGCITPANLNVPTEYAALKELGTIMGSGGLIVMNEDTCMVDTARFYMEFIQEESCGQCVPCRVGTKRMLEILTNITEGKGQEGDIEKLLLLGEAISETAICGLGQTAANPVVSTIKNFREEFEEHIKYGKCRAGVCSALLLSPCQNACPAGVNVPGYTALIAEGRFVDAYNLIRQENPFPSVCGRICTRPCESKCRRAMTDEAIAICDLKRFAADYAHKTDQAAFAADALPSNGKKVSIIGAGPAGLTCAHYLVRLGYEVDVYEAQGIAGGVLAYGIPEYRLPKDVVAAEVKLFEDEGVNIHLNTGICAAAFAELRESSDAVFVSAGAQAALKAGLPGEELRGVIPGLDFLKKVNLGEAVQAGSNVVVIGGGNTAIDSARTALRLGAEKVTILYRRTRDAMPANEMEIHEALEEGIELAELASPVRFLGDDEGNVVGIECEAMALGTFGPDGRRKAVASGKPPFVIECDMVIPAISQKADLAFAEGVERTRWDTLVFDRDSMAASMDGVFAGGDVVRGPDTAIQAIADGKKAAAAIDKYLGGAGILNRGAEIGINFKGDEDEIVELPRYPMELMSPEKRKCCFDEVAPGYHKLTAIAESMRCLHCERR
ncbi:MAG: FAD-dependent oxidoreductase [Oscillospiraceae bacterium]|nr:FAD-dependent oxidoreductase [Oscillospiraceae bacterium]